MTLAEQIVAIHALHVQGKSLPEIAAVVGLEIGDVASVVGAGSLMPELSGGSPNNWAIIALTGSPALVTLNSGNFWYKQLAEADIAIQVQSGTDFSIGVGESRPSSGAVLSAAGGRFQAAAYIAPQEFGSPAVALDPGSTKQRFASLGCFVGSDAGLPLPFITLGIDLVVPIVAPADDPNGINQGIGVSTPGFVGPGGVVIENIFLSLLAPHGTDSVPLNVTMAVWKI